MSIKVDVGTPPEGYKEWTTALVHFHGFANQSTTRGEEVVSPKFSCFGHQWSLIIYPGGEEDSDEGCVSLGLINRSNASIGIQWSFSVRNADCKEVVHYPPQTNEFNPGINSWVAHDFAPRSTLLDLLVQGSLIVEVRMKPTSTDKSITQFIPTNPIYKNVLQKYMDEESADVVFQVDNNDGSLEGEEHISKKSKTTTTLYAHRFILQDISTMLAELCKSDEGEGITTVSITDVKPEIFKHMLYNAYGGKLSEDELNNNAKDIMNACDKYGVVHLKLEAEACYVKSNEITMDNMMDTLLYADSKNLALLKEAVMDYIAANKHSIIGKVSLDNFPGHLATDLLTAVARGEQSEGSGGGEEDESAKYNRMRVGMLRMMLDEKGLDVDGSREAMIALLKEHNNAEASACYV